MNDEVTVTAPIQSLGTAGASAPSGNTVNTGNFATQTLASDLEPLSYETGDQRARNFSFGLNIRDTDTNFTRNIVDAEDRNKDFNRDLTECLYTPAQISALEDCANSLMSEVCGNVFSRREDLIECADKIFDLACSQEMRMQENILCQIEEAKCQFYRQVNSRWALVSRAVGSSRNTFVIQQQDTAMVDLTRRLASLRAELFNNAIEQSQRSLEQAFSVKAVSRIDNYEASHGNMISLWNLIRGAKRTLDEDVNENDTVDRTSDEESFQDVTTFDWAGKYAERVSQANEVAGTYNADYGAAGVAQALLGIITP